MKRYLWTAMVLLFVGANASDNPFDLNANLKKIDQDQDALLSELRDVARAKEAKAGKVEDVKVDTSPNVSKEETIPVDEAVVIQAKVMEEERIKKIKEEQAKIEAQRVQEEQAKVDQERLAAEKLEVEKYEAQRVAKNKLKAEKSAQLEAEKAKLESEKLSQEKKEASKNLIVDINTTREEIEATKVADKAYKEAVAKVDKEGDLDQLKAENEKLVQEKEEVVKSVNSSPEEIEATKVTDKAYKEAVVTVDKEQDLAQLKVEEEKQEATKSAIADINITHEEIEAGKEADKTYEEAIIEMNKED
ncbi:MAG: hypothetical protein U9R13_05790 [Campylobacterota bacterium]|nr:hypothetical protein [Campylobacterota bacterium]